MTESDQQMPQPAEEMLPGGKLSVWLDECIRLPGDFSIGLDGLIGLIPGVGDALGASLSFWIVLQAYRQRAPKRILLRMLFNIGIDTLVGTVPVLGDLFDFFWMANQRNMKLLREVHGQQLNKVKSEQGDVLMQQLCVEHGARRLIVMGGILILIGGIISTLFYGLIAF
jgi:hypothetical protein